VKRECEETNKEMSHLTTNFRLILTIILIFVTVNIHNILPWLKAGETPAPTVNDILNYAVFHSSPCTHQSDAASNPSRPALLYSGLVADYDADFVVNWIELRTVRRPQIWKFIGVTMISEIIALLE